MKLILDNLLLLQKLELQGKRASGDEVGPEEVRKKLPPQVLEHYDRLRQRGKKGVAFVTNGVCGQCHMRVAVGLLAALRRQDNLYRCENCGSYLQLMEPAPLAMPPRVTKPRRRGRPPKTETAPVEPGAQTTHVA
jgi:hypothetical protein